MTKTDYDPDRSLVLIEGLSHFLTNHPDDDDDDLEEQEENSQEEFSNS
jgi:adenosyl cobinamide kinase/adenosyl cobinamide phosphate guanylyltransferase